MEKKAPTVLLWLLISPLIFLAGSIAFYSTCLAAGGVAVRSPIDLSLVVVIGIAAGTVAAVLVIACLVWLVLWVGDARKK
jgi:hypothetical protein